MCWRRHGLTVRDFWDDAARRNAAWYVDTSLDYDSPDMTKFFAAGEEIVAATVDSSPVDPPGHAFAVEIGSGLGRVCQALARRFAHVVGVDVSPEMVRRARELVTEANVEFVVNDGADLSEVTSGSADVVLSFTVFQHIPDVTVIERYIDEAGRVLKRGGIFVFQWNNGPHPFLWRQRARVLHALQTVRLRRERYERHDAAFLGCRVPLARIRGRLEYAGFALEQVTGEGSLWAFAWAVRR